VRADDGLLVPAGDGRVLRVDADGNEVVILGSHTPGTHRQLIPQGLGFAVIESGLGELIDIHDDTGAFVVRHEFSNDPPPGAPSWAPCEHLLLPDVGWTVYVEGPVGDDECVYERLRLLAADGSEVVRMTPSDDGWLHPLVGGKVGVYGTTADGPDQTVLLMDLDGAELWRFDAGGALHPNQLTVAWATDDIAFKASPETAYHVRGGTPIATLAYAAGWEVSRVRIAHGGRYMAVSGVDDSDPSDPTEAVVLEDGAELWRSDVGQGTLLDGISDRGEALVRPSPAYEDEIMLLDQQGRVAWEQAAVESLYPMEWFPGGDRFLVVDFDLQQGRYTVWRIVR
jgi:outer membrane protein assembly factor BamB